MGFNFKLWSSQLSLHMRGSIQFNFMLLPVTEVMIWKNRYKIIQTPATGHQRWLALQSQKTAHARKEGMLHGKIISSYLMGKGVYNYSQFWK